jgi:membrane protein implicated in regulation of membrane protease activity
VVAVLFGLAALWILMSVFTAAMASPDDVGVLIVLAVIAFFVLRNWTRSRRRPPDGP